MRPPPFFWGRFRPRKSMSGERKGRKNTNHYVLFHELSSLIAFISATRDHHRPHAFVLARKVCLVTLHRDCEFGIALLKD